ncbi:MAG: VWA domain-containing protein [Myxococcales bacterium FL481]|nr:MAG: VWA domain-containing protein [Myxococcales bacterium FL481]
MLLAFFYTLRNAGLPVSSHDWLTLLDALRAGVHGHSLAGFYEVARCVLVTHEAQYDAFDLAFAATFRGLEGTREQVVARLRDWLAGAVPTPDLDAEQLAALERLDLGELRQRFFERLAEQQGRHQGGGHFIGTGGFSPFGHGGVHPTGVRVGGLAGGRSALAVASARRFREMRHDVVLDTRQLATALRRLRRLAREGPRDELDIEATVHATARNAGELDLVWRADRRNDVRLLLLLDVGGSMDPHASLVSRLFSAAHQAGGFRELRAYYFHNCVYRRVYTGADFRHSVPVDQLVSSLNERWYLVLVGDAWMHPGELLMTSGDFFDTQRGPSGLDWLARLARRFPRSAWLNPEPEARWAAPTIAEIRQLFAMFPLTVNGIEAMVDALRAGTPRARTAG